MTINITKDFETYSELPIEHGAWNYSMHHSTIPLILSYKFDDNNTEEWNILKGTKLPIKLYELIMDTDFISIAHNYWFEFCIWNNCCVTKFNWPTIPKEKWFDTMHQCGMSAIPLGLESAAKALKLDQYKMDEGKSLIKLFSIPQKDGNRILPENRPNEFEKFIEYCIRDTDVTRSIYKTLLKFKDREIDFIRMTHDLNMTGIPVDIPSMKVIYEKVVKEKASYVEKITKLTEGKITTINQTQRMKKWLNDNFEIDVPNFQAKTVEQILEGKYGKLHEDAKSLVEMRYFGGKSSTSKFESALKTVSEDGSIRGVTLYHGARTGRYVGRGFQPLNLPKPSVKYESMDLLIKDLVEMDKNQLNAKYTSLMRAASSAIRGMIKPPKGNELYGADYAAIEARVVFWLARCKRGLQVYIDKKDAYIDMASIIFRIPTSSIGDKERWVGKQAILGCGYGLAWRGFINTCAQYDQIIEQPLAEKTIEAYRNTYKEVPELWDDMNKKAMIAVRTGKQTFAADNKISFKTLKHINNMVFLYMKLPSGRLISYPDVRIQKVLTPWGAMQNAITYKALENNHWHRVSTYGGKLTENACQAIARDIMFEGMWNAQKAGFKVILQIYDELISYAPIGFKSLKEYEELLCNPMPEWSKDLPLVAEGKILTRYQKL